jgi:hypothetical protein
MNADKDITHSRGRYSLSARSLLELLSYLKSSYPEDILECTICTEVRFHGFHVRFEPKLPVIDSNARRCLHNPELQSQITLPLLQELPTATIPQELPNVQKGMAS